MYFLVAVVKKFTDFAEKGSACSAHQLIKYGASPLGARRILLCPPRADNFKRPRKKADSALFVPIGPDFFGILRLLNCFTYNIGVFFYFSYCQGHNFVIELNCGDKFFHIM